jgi:phosphoglycolate phosphatase-like HAD superfamily hydrolase
VASGVTTVILFDVDGTLVRTGGSGRRALDDAFRKLWGLEKASRTVDFAGKPDLRNFTEVFEANFHRKPTRTELKKAADAYLEALPGEVRRSVREGKYEVIPGAPELVRELSKRPGVRVGLGTGNFEKGARLKLGPSRLNRYFSFGGYGEDDYDRAYILRCGVKRSGAKRADVVIIGDTPIDVEAGRKNGYRTACVTAGFSTVKELKAAKPDHLSRDFRPLEKWLKVLLNGNSNG